MEATWRLEAGGTRTVHARVDLARGTTVWLDGRIVADDASWRVDRTYPLPLAGHEAALTVVGAWPVRTRAELRVDGVAVAPGPAEPGRVAPRRPIPWWGRAASGLAMASLLAGILIAPLSILFSLAALRRSRAAPGTKGRAAGTAAFAVAPWVGALLWNAALDRAGGRSVLAAAGPIIWPILVLGFAAIALGMAHIAQMHRITLVRALAAGALVSSLGSYGSWSTKREVEEMIPMMNPADVREIVAAAEREAHIPRGFASAFLLLGWTFAGVGALRGAWREGHPPAPAPPA